MYRKNLIHTLLIICTVALLLTGCGGIDVAKLVEKPIAYKAPSYKEDVEKEFCPTALSEYDGAYIEITPVTGSGLRINDMAYVAQQIIAAANDQKAYIDEDFSGAFDNEVVIYSKSNEELLRIMVSSDETLYARRDKDSPIFRLPHYAYYAMEAWLWKAGSSLTVPLSKWKPSEEELYLLELRLPHDIKTMLHQIHGYSDAYFLNFKVYSILPEKQYVKVYALIGYGGYSIDTGGSEIEFAIKFHDVTPVQLTYTWVNGEDWRLTRFKLPTYDKDQPNARLRESQVRVILPFKDTQQAMKDLADTSEIILEIRRQALDYLRETGQGDIDIDDKIN